MKNIFQTLLGKVCSAACLFAVALSAHAQAPQGASAQDIARGAYLVEGLGHCGACHTPRGIGFQEKGYTAADPLFLDGAVIEGWIANSLRDSQLTQDEIVELLKFGVSQKKGIAGPMRAVITESMQHLTDEDLNSIAAYLVSLQNPVQPKENTDSQVSVSPNANASGLYMSYCSTCHGASGQGVPRAIPALAGNSNVIAKDARNMIHIIYSGAHTPTIEGRASYVMPAYKEILTEEQMIEVINHIRQAWGNQAPAITAKEYKNVTK